MPLENTSRCPRLVSCLGMKLSPAWNEARRGKSAKLVLAAMTRISIVPACSSPQRSPRPKTPSPIWEITVGTPSS